MSVGSFEQIGALRGGRFLGLRGPARAWFISRLSETTRSLVVICKDRADAEDLETDLQFFIRDRRILLFPAWDTLPFENVSPQHEVQAQRLLALHLLHSGTPHIIVATADSLLQKLLPQSQLSKLAFSCAPAHPLARGELIQRLTRAGYQQVSLVEDIGEMALRGGVVDFYPPGVTNPIRAQFFGDAAHPEAPLTELKYFETDSQRSTEVTPAVTVVPVRELLPLHADPGLHPLMLEGIERLKVRGKALEVPPREVAKHMLALRHGTQLPGIELTQAVALVHKESLLSRMSEDSLVLLCDPLGLEQALDRYDELISEREARLPEEHLLLPAREDLYSTPAEVLRELKELKPASLDVLEIQDAEGGPAPVRFQTASLGALSTKLTAGVL